MVLTATTSGYTLLVADDGAQVTAAQRLRHRIFAEELGATLHNPAPGLDVDEFDAHCDHLVVRDNASGEVVGTYRMLPPGRLPRRYADGEFDMAALDPLRDRLVETRAACRGGGPRPLSTPAVIMVSAASPSACRAARFMITAAARREAYRDVSCLVLRYIAIVGVAYAHPSGFLRRHRWPDGPWRVPSG